MDKYYRYAITTLLLCFFVSTNLNAEPNRDSEQQAIELFYRVIAEQYPHIDLTNRILILHDFEGYWELTYELPLGYIGGTPVVTIDKETLRLIRVSSGQ
jgi:hypothetical protein